MNVVLILLAAIVLYLFIEQRKLKNNVLEVEELENGKTLIKHKGKVIYNGIKK